MYVKSIMIEEELIGIWALHLRGLVFKKENMGAIVC